MAQTVPCFIPGLQRVGTHRVHIGSFVVFMEVYRGSVFLGHCTYSFMLDHMQLQGEMVSLRTPDPLSLPSDNASFQGDADSTSQGSFDLVENAEPTQFTCTVCHLPYDGPYIYCSFCKQNEPEHHGGCCYANPNRREGQGPTSKDNRLGRLRKDLMQARTGMIKLTADLKDANEFSRKARLEAFDLVCARA